MLSRCFYRENTLPRRLFQAVDGGRLVNFWQFFTRDRARKFTFYKINKGSKSPL